MTRSKKARNSWLLLAPLASIGCSDQQAPIRPEPSSSHVAALTADTVDYSWRDNYPHCQTDDIQTLILENAGKKFDAYHLPTEEENDRTEKLIDALGSNDGAAIGEHAAALHMAPCTVSTGGETDVVFFHIPWEENQEIQYNLAFFWRTGLMNVPSTVDVASYHHPDYVDPLILEAPHTGSDTTYRLAGALFKETRALALLVNAAKKKSSPVTVAGVEAGDYPVSEFPDYECQGPDRENSDSAHSYYSQLNQAHKFLMDLYPEALLVNLHGMAKQKDYPDMAIAPGNGKKFLDSDLDPGNQRRSGARLLAMALSKVMTDDLEKMVSVCSSAGDRANMDLDAADDGEDSFFPLQRACTGTNVQAHMSYQDQNPRQHCERGDPNGKFMHIEHAPTYRDGGADHDELRSKAAQAYNKMMVEYVEYYSATIKINEVMFNVPPGPAGDANGDGIRDEFSDEFVELVNTSTADVDVSGWTLSNREDGVVFTFPPNTGLKPGEIVVVFGGVDPDSGFGSHFPSTLQIFAAQQGVANGFGDGDATNLRSGHEHVVLRDASGADVDEIYWGDTEPKTRFGENIGFGGNQDVRQSITRSPDLSSTWVKHTSLFDGAPFSPGAYNDGTFPAE